MPDAKTLQEQHDEQRYTRLRSFARRKQRWGSDNGHLPTMPLLPPPPTPEEWQRWLERTPEHGGSVGTHKF